MGQLLACDPGGGDWGGHEDRIGSNVSTGCTAPLPSSSPAFPPLLPGTA